MWDNQARGKGVPTADIVSVARQRRRKNKQQQDMQGRKPRSSSDTSLETSSVKGLGDGQQANGGSLDEVDGHGAEPDEVNDFYSLLNCTLHLPEAEIPLSHPISPTPAALEGSKGEVSLPSGRLAERIRALRLYICSLHAHLTSSLIVACIGSVKVI